MVFDRRCHPRQVVYSALYVHLSPDSGGLLSDLSEGGLALDLFVPAVSGQAARLGFELPGTSNRIEADCQIAWTDESGQKAGLRFLDLPERPHQHIREWLAVRALSGDLDEAITTQPDVGIDEPVSSTPSGVAQSPELGRTLLIDLRSALSPPQTISKPKQGEQAEQDTLERQGWDRGSMKTILGTRPLVALFVGAAALSGLTFVFGYVLGRGQFSSTSRTAPIVDKQTVQPSAVPALSAKLTVVSATDTTLSAPLIPRGAIVLQVAALTRESDAVAIAEALRQKKFPAFVLTPSTDQYYRVQVGPYADAESAHKARRRLEKEGLKAIVKR